eukprot:353640-Chlamydomonas_euryale.AAC.4
MPHGPRVMSHPPRAIRASQVSPTMGRPANSHSCLALGGSARGQQLLNELLSIVAMLSMTTQRLTWPSDRWPV